MPKKFDVVIGNPPYQEEAKGSGTRDTPVYHLFMDAAYELGDKAILITPARFLFNAGFTPKAWNEKMLADTHLQVAHYVDNSDKLFPGTDIKGGIAVTFRDASKVGAPIGTFTKYPELNDILIKVVSQRPVPLSTVVSSGRAYAFTQRMHDEHPSATDIMSSDAQFRVSTNAFEQLSFLFSEQNPSATTDHVEVLGLLSNKRTSRWIPREYLSGPASFERFKVLIPKANGSGAFGEVLASPCVLVPNQAVTMSFLTIGAFDTSAEAENCLSYVKSKFARALLGVLKITQDNPAKVWQYVPTQDFTASSDIDWTKPIPEIDQQLYSKYGLDTEEIAFIEDNVKPMA